MTFVAPGSRMPFVESHETAAPAPEPPITNSTGDPAPGGDSPSPKGATISRSRLVLVDALIAVTTLLLVVGVFSVWANRLLFSPDNWSNTSTQLLQNPQIRSATANYLVDQLYANVNVAGLIKSALPPRLQGLAAPAAGALRNPAVQGAEVALTRPRVQSLWASANRAADKTFIAVVNGGKGAVGVNQGVVTLNLGLILDNVAARLGLPANLSAKLPPNVANLTVIRSNQIKFVQNVGSAIKGLALWLTIIVPLLYLLAIGLAAGHRRRTLMTIGWAVILGGVLVLLGRSILQTQIANSLTNDAALRPAIRATIGIATAMLSEIGAACIYVAAAFVVAAWLAGPQRAPVTARRAMAPFLREHPVGSYAITLGVMVLIFIWDPIHATGTPAGIIVFTVLALVGTFLLQRQTAREFPDAQRGAATAQMRARLSTLRAARDGSREAGAQATVPDQLRQLAELRERGDLTGEEYQTAKEQLLHAS